MLKTIFLLGFLVLLSISKLSSQSVVNATGSTLFAGNERLDYSIGEIAITTLSNPQNHLTQGVLQPFTILVGTNILFDKQFAFSAFPNPVASELIIETDYTGFQMLEIYDIGGKRLFHRPWDEKPIDFQMLSAGTYLVKLSDNSFSKSIKIINQ